MIPGKTLIPALLAFLALAVAVLFVLGETNVPPPTRTVDKTIDDSRFPR